MKEFTSPENDDFCRIPSQTAGYFCISTIDIRINTCYNITMIRKGDTKDANDLERDVKVS